MQYSKVPGVDKPVSRLVQGTVMIGPGNEDESFALLDAVFELGCNTFDTAHIYGGGGSERTLGKWIEARGVREQVVVLDKGCHQTQDRRRVTPFDVLADLHDGLARLKTDYIDLFVLHRDDESVPVGPIVDVLNENVQAGTIRAFGGSNWTHQRIQQANEYAEAHGLIPFAVSSPNYSLAEQVVVPWAGCISIAGPNGGAARQWYARTQMPVFPWSSLAGGFFSGRFRRDNLDTFTDGLDKVAAKCYGSEANFRRLDRAAELAEEKGLTVPQVATAYIMNQPVNVFALVGCRKGEEFKANVEALDVKLTAQELAWLDLGSEAR